MSVAAITNCIQQPVVWLAVGFAGQALFTARFGAFSSRAPRA